MARNPPWTTDEVLLALDLYFRRGMQDDTDSEVIALSDVVNALPINVGEHEATFRNANGVAMKLANFAHVDPDWSGQGLKSIGRRDREIFDAYTDRREECRKLADAIKAGVESGVLPETAEDDEDSVIEGRLLFRMHRSRERNPSMAKKKKAKTREKHGELACEVCNLSESVAEERFGELDGDLFECHHTKPLHTLTGTTKTRVADLSIVCPTCHRALHRIEPPVSVSDLRARVLGAPAV